MSKKRYDLPPLDFVQGFEAAARHLSFTHAARELHLTQSAVSRQIKALEDVLETRLFERRHRSLALTDEGRAFHELSVEVLNRLQDAIDQMRRRRSTNQLAVTTTTGFASLWLIPRLKRFTRVHPEIEVRLVANDRALNLDRSLIDLAIRYMPADAVPPGAETLFGEAIQPVCSPLLVAGNEVPLRRPEDLKSHTLLHLDYGPAHKTWYDWGTWLTSFGLDDLKPAGTLHFTRYDQMVQAAIDGQGVALGLSPLIDEQIRTGQLVAPFARTAPSSKAYVLMLARAAADRPEVAAFCDWLRQEAREGGA